MVANGGKTCQAEGTVQTRTERRERAGQLSEAPGVRVPCIQVRRGSVRWQRSQSGGGAERLPGDLGLTQPATERKIIPNKRTTQVAVCVRKATKAQS